MTCAPAIAADTLAAAGVGVRMIGPVRPGLPRYGRHDRARRRRGRGRVRGRPLAAAGICRRAPRGSTRPPSDSCATTMGWSKADVFAALLEPDAARGPPPSSPRPTRSSSPPGGAQPIPGALAVLRELRAAGRPGLPHHRLRAVDPRRPAGRARTGRRGRPGALARRRRAGPAGAGHGARRHGPPGGRDPAAVVGGRGHGERPRSGHAAGAGAVVGVLSGAHDEATLAQAPHTAIVARRDRAALAVP